MPSNAVRPFADDRDRPAEVEDRRREQQRKCSHAFGRRLHNISAPHEIDAPRRLAARENRRRRQHRPPSGSKTPSSAMRSPLRSTTNRQAVALSPLLHLSAISRPVSTGLPLTSTKPITGAQAELKCVRARHDLVRAAAAIDSRVDPQPEVELAPRRRQQIACRAGGSRPRRDPSRSMISQCARLNRSTRSVCHEILSGSGSRG